MKKIKISPLFLLVVALFVYLKKSLLFINTLLAIIIHEWAHVVVAKDRGYDLGGITLMPYGGSVSASGKIAPSDDVIISLAGPLSNMLVAVVCVALWWLVPTSYYFSNNLVKSSLCISLFNMLPIYPLDFSRIIIALAKNKQRALKILRWIGIVFGGIALIIFAVSIFYTITPSLAIIGVMTVVAAISGINKESDMDNLTRLGLLKDSDYPLEKKCVVVDGNLPLIRLTRLFSPSTIYTFEIVVNGRLVKIATEDDVIEWSTKHHRATKICDIINKKG